MYLLYLILLHWWIFKIVLFFMLYRFSHTVNRFDDEGRRPGVTFSLYAGLGMMSTRQFEGGRKQGDRDIEGYFIDIMH